MKVEIRNSCAGNKKEMVNIYVIFANRLKIESSFGSSNIPYNLRTSISFERQFYTNNPNTYFTIVLGTF